MGNANWPWYAAMMITIDTQITIEASPTKIWGILTDFPAMSAWNPFIRAISGSLASGKRLSVRIAPPGQAAMTFEPTEFWLRS